jgi:hypothetical protein
MLSNHVNIQPKRGVKIITCNPATRLIEAETRNGEVITINAYNYTPTFRWPIPGERWMVSEENGSWYLDSIYEPQSVPNPYPIFECDQAYAKGTIVEYPEESNKFYKKTS